MTWDPDQYLQFDTPRERPAFELLARINHPAAVSVLDLGCGPGNLTARLADRWPEATITAVDNDEAMLARAADVLSGAQLVAADIRTYLPAAPFDVVYSNATLHWLDDHDVLFPRVMSWLRPRGVLAVQMPTPDQQPSHLIMLDIASDPAWAERLLPRLRRGAVGDPTFYYDLLAPKTSHLDIWTVTYQQILSGADPVTEWMKGSALRPLLKDLDADEESNFLSRYAEEVAAHYRRRADGTTLFPYTRLFIVATVD